MKDFRIEKDIIGDKEVPIDAYYGVQTLRGKENFTISYQTLHKSMIDGLAIVKKACAITNCNAGLLETKKKDAIVQACDEILEGKLHDQFISDPIQGGAGTTANMNANEVIANRATEILGGKLGSYEFVHPNDHVNMGQSTNDVYPTAGKLGALILLENLIEQLEKLKKSMENKGQEFKSILKMGRTQLQDAVPITLGQEFKSYASVLNRDINRIKNASINIKYINMGASAIGTGINVDTDYFKNIVPEIAKLSNLDLKQSEDLIDGTSNQDSIAELSSAIKVLAINVSKISNDLRLMSSGPKTLIGDINLPPRQNGSSIMPGKVNPVIPEVVNQIAFRVIGNDMTISMAAEGGQLQLNAFEPVMFYSLYQSIEMMSRGLKTFRLNCIDGITANTLKLKDDVNRSIGIVTALVPHIGYTKATEIAKESLRTGEPIRKLVEEKNLLPKKSIDEILDTNAMTKPGIAAEYLLRKED